MSCETTLSLLESAQLGNQDACERILRENAGLLWGIVRRFYGRGIEGDDLYQLACLGFLKAIQGFDPSFGTQFSTYAVPKITGEIRRFLRDDGPIKVSRSIKEQAFAIRAARDKLQYLLGRSPHLSELCSETNLLPEEIASIELATEHVSSLQAPIGEDGLTLESSLDSGLSEEGLVEHIALREAIRQLSEREQSVIALRFFRGMTQEQAAHIIGISQVQISRIERKAIATLRLLLKEE